jgi:hypothetical protein
LTLGELVANRRDLPSAARELVVPQEMPAPEATEHQLQFSTGSEHVVELVGPGIEIDIAGLTQSGQHHHLPSFHPY